MSRLWLWTLAAVAALVPFAGLGHALWEVDDARYAEVPREMVTTGDWVTPHLDYLDYVEKPPLPYWLTAVSYKVFGVSEAAARLPLALWALIALAGTAWLGSWLFDPEVGLAAAAILGTCIEFFALSHVITPDLPLAATLLWTMALWLRALARPGDARWAGPAAGACMALAMLCKGLVAIVFPVAWVTGLALLFPELRAGFKRSLTGGLIPVFLLVAAPWFVVMQRRHPDFLMYFFGEQHFQRFMSGASRYRRYGPWYYFFPVELVGMLPWTPVLAAALRALAGPEAEQPGLRPARLLACWALGVFVFFSISSSKLPTYIMPLMPQQALLLAWTLLRGSPRVQSWIRGWGFGLGLALVLAVPVLPLALGRVEGPPMPPGATTLATATFAFMAAGTLACALGRAAWRLPAGAGCAAAAALLALAGAARAEGWISAKPIAEAIAAERGPGDRVLCYGVYLHGLAYYLQGPVDVVNWWGELAYAKRNSANAARFGNEDTIRALPEPGRQDFVALRRKEAEYFTSLAKPGALREMRSFGPWALARFSAGPDRTASPGSSGGPTPSR